MARPDHVLLDQWDRQAEAYDRRMAGIERRFLAGSRDWVGSRARGRVLEIAVGTGRNIDHYPDGVSLVGTDWSEGMLHRARAVATDHHLPTTLLRADAQALPFADASFDTVVITFALCSIADEETGLGEALRVLRPGGRLLLADHIRSWFWPLRAAQHLLDLFTVPLQGEHWTRRPLRTLRRMGADVTETERTTLGVVEHVCVVKGEPATRVPTGP